MSIAADILVLLVALLHVGFLVLEMFLWDRPPGLKIFRQSLERVRATRILAANQGLYNGFLAAGLLWGVVQGAQGAPTKIFFLVCVLVAGLYGAFSVNRSILIVQALPAALALVALFMAGP